MTFVKNLKITLLFSLVVCMTLAFLSLAHSAAHTKDQIIDKAWLAMVGEAKGRFADPNGDEVQTLYVETITPDKTIANRYSIVRPNLFRNENSDGVLVFDGKKAAWVKRYPDKEGNSRGPELIEQGSWMHFEVDIALLFPAFYDHPSKLRGIKKVGTREAYEIYVELPLGSNITYFVDTKSFLIIKRQVSWEGNPEQPLWGSWIDKYTKVQDMFYPAGYSFKGEKGDIFRQYRNVKFNQEFDPALFEISPNLKPPKK